MKLTLLKIGAKWCPSCVSADRRGTLDKFSKAHPDVKVEQHDDTEAGGSARWEAFADKWKVKNIPVLIWVSGGEEVLRSEDVTLADIEKQYRRALKIVGGE